MNPNVSWFTSNSFVPGHRFSSWPMTPWHRWVRKMTMRRRRQAVPGWATQKLNGHGSRCTPQQLLQATANDFICVFHSVQAQIHVKHRQTIPNILPDKKHCQQFGFIGRTALCLIAKVRPRLTCRPMYFSGSDRQKCKECREAWSGNTVHETAETNQQLIDVNSGSERINLWFILRIQMQNQQYQ